MLNVHLCYNQNKFSFKCMFGNFASAVLILGRYNISLNNICFFFFVALGICSQQCSLFINPVAKDGSIRSFCEIN